MSTRRSLYVPFIICAQLGCGSTGAGKYSSTALLRSSLHLCRGISCFENGLLKCACVHTHTHAHTHTHTHTQPTPCQSAPRMRGHVTVLRQFSGQDRCAYVYMHLRILMCVCMVVCTHTHTHTHTHTRACAACCTFLLLTAENLLRNCSCTSSLLLRRS